MDLAFCTVAGIIGFSIVVKRSKRRLGTVMLFGVVWYLFLRILFGVMEW